VDANLTGKRVLLVSDNDRLARAIELTLNESLKVQVASFWSGSPGQGENLVEANGHDLIVLALSSPTSEPIVFLRRASLIERVGQVPLLIISDRRFYADLDNQVFHLDFPFDAGDLLHKVEVILDGGLEPALLDARRSRSRASLAKSRLRRGEAKPTPLSGDGV
jgi:DNA-binding response OmpR family regulator